MDDSLAQAIIASAQRMQVDPRDLATVMSYETGGTFDPWQKGPTTQWGQHRGLIQWGEPQRKKYGVYEGMPVGEQVKAAENYWRDAGVKPGMGLMDLYSAVNAGAVGRYSASDANNGGAPGTVADKVNNQMAGHKQKAEQLLAGLFTPQATPAAQPVAQTPAAAVPGQTAQQPMMPAGADTSLGGLAALFGQQQLAKRKQREDEQQAEAIRRAALFSPQGVGGLYG